MCVHMQYILPGTIFLLLEGDVAWMLYDLVCRLSQCRCCMDACNSHRCVACLAQPAFSTRLLE